MIKIKIRWNHIKCLYRKDNKKFEGKEIVEIGRFVDDEIVSIETAQKINNNSKLDY